MKNRTKREIVPFFDEVFVGIYPYSGDYEVSNYGRVMSFKDKSTPILLSQKTNKDGYKEVGLWCRNKAKHRKVHQLVAEAFIDNYELKSNVNHIDFNRANNHVSNLEWADPIDDAKHRLLNDRYIRGDKHYSFGKFRGDSKTAKIVLDNITGIFYYCVKDAADAKDLKYSTLKGKLNGNDKNNTSLIYV